MSQAAQSNDFEKTLEELETVVLQLDGEVKLEKALELFERGVLLSKKCEEFLKGAEQKVEILKRLADGSIVSQKFDDGKTESQSSYDDEEDDEDDDDDDDDDEDEDEDEDDDDDDDDEEDDDEDEDDDDQYGQLKAKTASAPARRQAARSRKNTDSQLKISIEDK